MVSLLLLRFWCIVETTNGFCSLARSPIHPLLARVDDPPESLTPDDNFPKFLKSLQDFGFESIIDYDEAHGQSVELRSYLMAMKDGAARTNWFMNEAELQLKIKDRMLGTKDGSPPFRFFDAGKCRSCFRPKRTKNRLRVTDCALLFFRCKVRMFRNA